MCEVSAVRQIHRQKGIARFEQCHKDSHIRLGTGMGLDVDMLGPEQFFGSVSCQIFGYVDILTTAVVAATGITFGVFVGENRSDGFLNRSGSVVFRSDQLQPFLLTTHFVLHGLENFRIYVLQRTHGGTFLIVQFLVDIFQSKGQ